MPTRPTSLLLLAALTLLGCDPQGSSPVPQPVPGFVRTSTHDLQQVSLLVVGLPGAVVGQGKVHVEDRVSGSQVTAPATAKGTFSAVIAAGETRELWASFETGDGTSDPVPLTKERFDGPYPQLAKAATYGSVVSQPDAQGMVTVTNDDGPGNPPLFSATPEVDAIVTNGNTSDLVTSTTDASGLFSVQLPGSTGDPIHILLVDPDYDSQTSDFLTYTVP